MRDSWVGLQAGVDARRWARVLRRAHDVAVHGGHVPSIVREVIADSWERCSETGVDPGEPGAPLVVAPENAAARWHEHPLSQTTDIHGWQCSGAPIRDPGLFAEQAGSHARPVAALCPSGRVLAATGGWGSLIRGSRIEIPGDDRVVSEITLTDGTGAAIEPLGEGRLVRACGEPGEAGGSPIAGAPAPIRRLELRGHSRGRFFIPTASTASPSATRRSPSCSPATRTAWTRARWRGCSTGRPVTRSRSGPSCTGCGRSWGPRWRPAPTG